VFEPPLSIKGRYAVTQDTVRHRTVRSKGCLSNKTALAMIFKLAQAAEKHWRRLDGQNQLPKVILGITFNDGIEVAKEEAQTAARHQHSIIAPHRRACLRGRSDW
jgi:hypothetical protein